jgi:hypothetical protein
MACDERLVERIRGVLKRTRQRTRAANVWRGMLHIDGNMFCGVVKDEIMLRV